MVAHHSTARAIVALVLLGACGGEDPAMDAAPVVGSRVVLSETTATSTRATWGAATDDVTPSAELEYKVVMSAVAASAIDSVEEAETVVGIIETMKLMNSVYAGLSGTITEICAANGELVDPQRVLMRVQPEGR